MIASIILNFEFFSKFQVNKSKFREKSGSLFKGTSLLCYWEAGGGWHQLPVLQLAGMNMQSAEYFQCGLRNDEILALLANMNSTVRVYSTLKAD